ncbi:SprB repeat-containing protein, partial [Winogradskyella vincentii]
QDATTAQGCANGEATVAVSGGTAPYSFLWSNGQTTATATGLSDTTHSVTVTDANGCQLTQSIIIACVNTCDAEITIDSVTDVLCTGDATGSGTVSANSLANPSSTFTFTWSNGQVDTGVNTSTLSNVVAGVYTVSITIDGTVCQPVEDTISITEPSNVLNVTASSTDELGPSTGDGTATATATGGVEPYTYAWSNGETTETITDLSAGTYTVDVTDANGCTDQTTVTVNPGTCLNLSVSGSSSPVICNGESNGSVVATVTGGSGDFSYAWDSIPDTTLSVNNLPAGDYTITVTDNVTACTSNTTITINEPNALSSGIAITNILCKDDATGSLDLTVNGGVAPYTFVWSDGSTNEDLINVIAGTYSVTITDANGCTSTDSATIIEPATNVSVSLVSQTNIDCLSNSNGEFTVEGNGGVPPYSYSIDNGVTYQVSDTFSGLTDGDYTVTVQDANGCTLNTLVVTLTTDDVESPEITVPSTTTIEGCSTSDITTLSAVFNFSTTQSSDVKSIFATNSEYNATDDFNILSITYIDVVTSTDNCPITVLRTFTITDNCSNTATATQTITVQDTTPPTI